MGNIEKEIERFSSEQVGLPLPRTHSYWVTQCLKPKMNEIFGADNNVQFYVNAVCELTVKTPSILSIGSGNSRVEIAIAQVLVQRGRMGIFHCLELAPPRVEEANRAIFDAGLDSVMKSMCVNIDDWAPTRQYDFIMANHSLHHIVGLERLFDQISMSLVPGGSFVSADMIGRNGHQRWPEVLVLINSIWRDLRPSLRRNTIFPKVGEEYDDRDFSLRHNEGIRAQDILPLLIDRFKFSGFLGLGGIVDPFIERVYGPNFSIDNDEDRTLLDKVFWLNEVMIDAGMVKPTMMWSVMKKPGDFSGAVKCYRHWTPQFSVRSPLRGLHQTPV